MKYIISWKEFSDDVVILAERLKSTKVLAKNIYGVPRGGLIPAVMLSHLTGLPLITSSRFISNETIVVDDIIDTGHTLKRLLARKKPLAVASVWYHPKAVIKPDFYVNLKKTEDWLVFPFETIKSSKYDKTV